MQQNKTVSILEMSQNLR